MNIKTAKHLLKIVVSFAFITLGVVPLNAAAAVINATTVDADISVDVSTVAGASQNGASAIDLDALGQVLDSDIVNTSIVPLPAAAWMFGAALLGLMGVARRRQTNES